MAGSIFTMVHSGCQSGMSQLSGLFSMVTGLVMQPMKAIVQSVMGGVWIGDGADAFVNEVSSLCMPGVDKVGQQLNFMKDNIAKAVDTIDQAENQAKGIVNGLGDLFGSIYSG